MVHPVVPEYHGDGVELLWAEWTLALLGQSFVVAHVVLHLLHEPGVELAPGTRRESGRKEVSADFCSKQRGSELG